jgi:hypothetical protein
VRAAPGHDGFVGTFRGERTDHVELGLGKWLRWC